MTGRGCRDDALAHPDGGSGGGEVSRGFGLRHPGGSGADPGIDLGYVRHGFPPRSLRWTLLNCVRRREEFIPIGEVMRLRSEWVGFVDMGGLRGRGNTG